MFKELVKLYKSRSIKTTIGWVLTSIAVILFITFTVIMIEYVIPTNDINLIIKFGVIFFFVNIFRSVTTLFEDINNDTLQKEIECDYREKIYLKLQKLKQSEIDKIRVGEILENILNDTKQISKYYTLGICRAYAGGVLRLVGSLLVLAYLNIPIVLITFVIYLIGFVITFLFNKKSIYYTELQRSANAKILNWSNEQVEGYSTIKSLEIEEERISQINYLIKDYEKAVNKLEKNIRIYTFVYEFIISFVNVINIFLGTLSVENGIITYAVLVLLVKHIDTPKAYAQWVIEGFQIRNVGKIAYDKVMNILKKEEENIEAGKKLEKVDSIEFKNVEFNYENNQKTLQGISLFAKKGESIALVGRTGSGKTTLVNLICRFYDLQNGLIEINSEDYRNYSIKSLREKIGYIMQKVVIFNGTVLENINYANKEISKEKIVEICKELNLHNKIMELKNGYETQISPDTDLFSSGEKQLINFARVMVENPDIIILDEATASLSYKSELLVRQAVEKITQGRISFIIAHRLSTIQNCDKILLMMNGRIVEQGNHNELIKKQGEYYNLLC